MRHLTCLTVPRIGGTSDDLGRVSHPRRADLVERFAYRGGPGLMPALAKVPDMTHVLSVNLITRLAGHRLGDSPA